MLIATGLAAITVVLIINSGKWGYRKLWQDPSQFQLMSLKSVLPYALELAKDWREDAYLYQAMFSVYPKIADHTMTVVFFFRSENSQGGYVIYVQETEEGTIVAVEQDSEAANSPPPIDIDRLSMDSIEAFEYMHRNGGADFISIYGNREFFISFYLSAASRNIARWRLIYYLEAGPAWNFKMNAYTDKLYRPDIYEED